MEQRPSNSTNVMSPGAVRFGRIGRKRVVIVNLQLFTTSIFVINACCLLMIRFSDYNCNFFFLRVTMFVVRDVWRNCSGHLLDDIVDSQSGTPEFSKILLQSNSHSHNLSDTNGTWIVLIFGTPWPFPRWFELHNQEQKSFPKSCYNQILLLIICEIPVEYEWF